MTGTASTLQELEERLLDGAIRSSPEQLDALLAEEFVEFGARGRAYTKAEIIAALAEEQNVGGYVRANLLDFKALALSGEVVLVTYRSVRGAEESLRSSIWKKAGSGWRMLFHQGTKAANSR
jgi:hypothetical protein